MMQVKAICAITVVKDADTGKVIAKIEGVADRTLMLGMLEEAKIELDKVLTNPPSPITIPPPMNGNQFRA